MLKFLKAFKLRSHP